MPSQETNPSSTASVTGNGGRPVTLAVVIGAHGVTGEVRLKVFTDNLKPYRSFNEGRLTLKSVRDGSNGAIARFAEIVDRNAAEALRGTALTVPRSSLPPLDEGEYYHVDLIGLAVETDTGAPIGIVAAVENFGAGDILDIEQPDGKRFMVPVAQAEISEIATIDAAFLP
jgi:16S rRNA processing protein RimM